MVDVSNTWAMTDGNEAAARIAHRLVNKTVETADDLSATAQSVDYTEDENRRAAAALQGLL